MEIEFEKVAPPKRYPTDEERKILKAVADMFEFVRLSFGCSPFTSLLNVIDVIDEAKQWFVESVKINAAIFHLQMEVAERALEILEAMGEEVFYHPEDGPYSRDVKEYIDNLMIARKVVDDRDNQYQKALDESKNKEERKWEEAGGLKSTRANS